MKRILLFFLSIFSLFLLISSQANGFNPKIVYRADGRSPDIVFVVGFTSWGSNNNIVAHALGLTGSLGDRTSAFIPTSSNPGSAMRFVNNILSINPRGFRYYMYDIRADGNFYYLSNIVNDIYDRNYRRRIGDDFRATLGAEVEYTAYRQIHPSQIRGVSTYYHNNQGELVNEYTENRNYVDLDTKANNGNNFPADWVGTVPGIATAFILIENDPVRASQVPDYFPASIVFISVAIFEYFSNLFHCCHK